MTSMLDTPTPSAERLVDLGDQEFTFSVSDFERVRKLIYDRAGISLHEGKQAMVYSRLSMEAKIFGGGAVISGMTSMNVGERNTKFVQNFLSTERIPVVSSDVMDIYPRKVCFLPASGKAMVKRLAPTNADALLVQERIAARKATPDNTGGGSVDLF